MILDKHKQNYHHSNHFHTLEWQFQCVEMITETYRPNLADNRILQVIRCCEAQKDPETLMSYLVPLVLKMLVMLLEHVVRALHMSLKAVGHLCKRKVMAARKRDGIACTHSIFFIYI